MADYTAEWARYTDWCTATGRSPLPATPDQVLAYLTEERPAGGTAGRWCAAITAAHRAAGASDPCTGPVRAWLRRARRALPPDAEAALADLAGTAGLLPATGWPTGVFGRRDRLALLLHRLAALPATALVRLRTADLTITAPRRITVTAGDAQIRLPGGGDPAVCVACTALRWRRVLRDTAAHRTRDLAGALTNGTTLTPGHPCGKLTSPVVAGPAGWPLFPAVTRWGTTWPDPVPPMTARAMQSLLRAAGRGTGTHRDIPVPDRWRGDPRPAAVPPPPPAIPRLDPHWHRQGLQAKADARRTLEEILDRLDELDTALDEAGHRAQRLLDQAAGLGPGRG